MSERRILVLYGTRHGQTARIARHVAEQLRAHGHDVRLADGEALPERLEPRSWDAVIVGASVIAGEHSRRVRHFVQRNAATLNGIPSAFFSVSASAASPHERGRADARRYVTEFLDDTGWHPALAEPMAGAIAYTRYDPFTRWMMRRICAEHDGPTDTSRDHEMTDWSQVQRFVEQFAGLMAHAEEAPQPAVA